MAKAEEKKDKTAIWQKQANHFREVITEAQEIINDPDNTPEERNEAENTVKSMMSNLERLHTKYGVSPEGEEEPPPPTV